MAPEVQPARPPARVPAHAATTGITDTPAAAAAVADDSLSVILVTAGYDHTIRFWEAWSGACSRSIQHPGSQVNKLAISPDKRVLAVAGHSSVRLFDTSAGAPPKGQDSRGYAASSQVKPLTTFEGHTNNVTSIAWHYDGKWLVSGSEDGTLRIWDTRYVATNQNFARAARVRPRGAGQ